MKFEGFFHIQNFIPQLDGFRAVIFSWFGWNIHRHLWLWKPLAFPRDLCKSLLIFLLFLQLPATTVEIETTAQGNGKDRGFSCDSLMICLMSNHEIFGDSIWFHMIPYESISHRIHGAGIYTNIGGILMGSMLPYIAYMDPMGYDSICVWSIVSLAACSSQIRSTHSGWPTQSVRSPHSAGVVSLVTFRLGRWIC
jgi:hypothetical protein